MKTVLFFLLLLPSLGFAETVNIVFRPNGSSCRHVLIQREDGSLFHVTTEGEIIDNNTESDAYIIRQIKRAVRASGCALNDRPCLRTYIEAQEFDLQDVKR